MLSWTVLASLSTAIGEMTPTSQEGKVECKPSWGMIYVWPRSCPWEGVSPAWLWGNIEPT